MSAGSAEGSTLRLEPDRPWGTLRIVERGAPVGEAVLTRPRDGSVELVVVVVPEARGRGIGGEIAARLVERAFSAPEVTRVVAHTPPGAPTRALEVLGFAREGEVVDPDDGPLDRWARARHPADGFFGAWELVPEACVYEAGTPPRDGRYSLAPIPDGVAFAVDWTEPDGSARHVAFTARFGEAEGFAMTREGDVLETRAPAGPVRVARRERSADGRTLRVVQEGFGADGEPFANVAAYHRVAWGPASP